MRDELIRPVLIGDTAAIARIYNHYILNSVVTFEEQAVSCVEISARIKIVQDAPLPWLVIERDAQVVGYAYATKWIGRSAYRYSAECTVYLDHEVVGSGLGSALYRALFEILRSQRMHIVIAGIVLPNQSSVALHEKFGFTKCAHFKEIGFKFNQWLDVGYWQMPL